MPEPSSIPGTPEYRRRTEYLRATGFSQEAAARDTYEFQSGFDRQSQDVTSGQRIDLADTLADQRFIPLERPQGRVVFEPFTEKSSGEHIRLLRQQIEQLQPSKEKDSALARLTECEMWLGRAPR